MVYGKLQSIFKFFKGMSALDIVKYLFVGIPILILGFLYLFMAQGDIEKMFNEPLIVGQLLLVLAMPFCYLAMRNICQDLKDRKKRDGLLIPLWILIVYQVTSFNMICSFLIIYGTFQEYGKGMFAIKKFTINNSTKAMLVGLIPLGMLYGLVLFVKIRLGILF